MFDVSIQSFVFYSVNVNVRWNSWQLRSALAILPLSDELQAPLASGKESIKTGNEPKPTKVASPSAHPTSLGIDEGLSQTLSLLCS